VEGEAGGYGSNGEKEEGGDLEKGRKKGKKEVAGGMRRGVEWRRRS